MLENQEKTAFSNTPYTRRLGTTTEDGKEAEPARRRLIWTSKQKVPLFNKYQENKYNWLGFMLKLPYYFVNSIFEIYAWALYF